MGAAVYLDGERQCATPCGATLPDGAYTLRLTVGETTVDRTIRVGAAEANVFRFDAATRAWSLTHRVE
jgi:hypothetical protein